jgi:hypothetical protein
MIASEHLLADPWRHRGSRALRRRGVERAQIRGIARCALERLARDVDLLAGAILCGIPAIWTL